MRLFGIAFFVGTLCLSGSSAQEAAPLQVVTYNIRYANPGDGEDVWENRIDAVSSFLDQHDLAGLQEVTHSQLLDLRARLTAFDFYGVGRDDGKHQGEHAVIFYRRERLQAIQQGTFWLSESPGQVGVPGWDASLPRTCTWMILRETISGVTLLVANTHFDHLGAKSRAESGKLVLQRLRNRAGEMPVILLGDFNCQPDSEPYQALTSGGYLVDARRVGETAVEGPNSTWNGFNAIEPGRVIDHLFVHGGLKVRTLKTLDPRTERGRFASDHLPVCAWIELNWPETRK